jgi:acetate kinase
VRVLTVNAGSTSLKLETYALAEPLPPLGVPPEPLASASAGRDGWDALLEAALGAEIDIVAHRFVRVPQGMTPVIPLDEKALASISRVASDAPLHAAPALRAVAELQRLRPGVRQYAVADSAFHRTLTPAAFTYAIPRELSRFGLRRIGYHGLSHEYAAHRGAELAALDVRHARIVTVHLGGGSSLCAVRNGESIDTTMGYTPLEGLPMATRSGSVDPGVILRLLRMGMTLDELEDTLERRSGLLGISGGRSGDIRDLIAADDDPSAKLALDVLAWRGRTALGSMIAALEGVDLITFTGGIGEHVPSIRAAVLRGAAACGGALDEAANDALQGEGRISAPAARVACYVVAARENWQLARSAVSAATEV